MAITYSWHIMGMRTINSDPVTDAVYKVEILKRGVDSEDGVGAGVKQSVPLDVSDLDVDNFTAFSDLSQDQVIQWVQNTLTDNEEEVLNQRILSAIQKKRQSKKIISASDLPWLN